MKHNDLKILIKEIISVLLKEVTLRGEWWFQNGQALFADGDVGDMNHEAYVLDSLNRHILDVLGVDSSRFDNAPNFYEVGDEIFENIKEDLTEEERQQWIEGTNADVEEIIPDYLKRSGDKESYEMLKYVNSPNHDPREYALKYWGWQRVKGNVIQTETLTDRDIKYITNGLYDAYGSELEEDPNITFNIEVMSTRSWYEDIPWVVLQKDSPTALNPYRSRY